jgi:hypothetical protein
MLLPLLFKLENAQKEIGDIVVVSKKKFLLSSQKVVGISRFEALLVVLTNETLLPPLVLPSTTVKTRPGGRDVFSSIPGLPLGRQGSFCCLLLRL